MSKIGFTTVTFRDLSRREVCQIAKDNGIEILEWGGDVHLPPGDKEALDEVLALQKEFSIKAASYGSYYRLGDNDMDMWQKTVDTASAIGAKYIRIWQGSLGSKKVDDAYLQSMVKETKQLAKIAKQKDLVVAFEFHKKTNNDTGKSCVEFLKAVNEENVKTYWQPFSYLNDVKVLKEVVPYAVTIHVFSWNKACKRFPLDKHERKWKKFISIIKEANTNPNYIMEFVKDDDPKQFAQDLKALRSYLD